jgi:hypothetical protein
MYVFNGCLKKLEDVLVFETVETVYYLRIFINPWINPGVNAVVAARTVLTVSSLSNL